jgi:hypothetical protein
VINARLGTVALGATDTYTLDLYGDGLVNFAAGTAGANNVTNTGAINAQGGVIQLTANTAAGVVNDLSLGTYGIVIDETSLSEAFKAAQFEEILSLKQMGVPVPDDHLVDASTYGRKTELKRAIAEARATRAAKGMPQPDQAGTGPGPGGSRVGPDGGSVSNDAAEAGAPPT